MRATRTSLITLYIHLGKLIHKKIGISKAEKPKYSKINLHESKVYVR